MMNLLQEAAELNESGARHYASNETSLALKHFKHALQLVTEAARNWNVQLEADEEIVVRNCSVVPYDMNFLPRNRDEKSFIYGKPLMFRHEPLPGTDSTDQGIDSVDLPLYSSVIMFNLALTFHTVGTDSALQKAQKLYDLSLSNIESSLNHNESCIAAVPILNNKAQVHYELSDYTEAVSTSDNLAEVIAYLTTSQEDERSANLLAFEVQDVQSMLLNVFLISTSPTAPAA